MHDCNLRGQELEEPQPQKSLVRRSIEERGWKVAFLGYPTPHQCFPTADWLSTGAWEESRHLHSNKRADIASTSAEAFSLFYLFFPSYFRTGLEGKQQ